MCLVEWTRVIGPGSTLQPHPFALAETEDLTMRNSTLQRFLACMVCIYVPGSRFATTPPPPPHGMVPKPAFCSIPHENVVFAVFFAWWVAGAVRKPANSLDFCNQPSENLLFAMFWLRHRGVVQPRPLLFLCQLVI